MRLFTTLKWQTQLRMWCNTRMVSVSGSAQIQHNTYNEHQHSASTTTLHAWRTTTDERGSLLTILRPLARLAAGDPTNFAKPRYVLRAIFVTGFRVHSGIGTCRTLKATETCLASTYKPAHLFYRNWTSPQWLTGSRRFDTSGLETSGTN
jgi:hypothetical protein